MKRQELVQLLPVLQGLGVDATKIKEEIIRQFDLPKSFAEVQVEEAKVPASVQAPEAPPQGLPAEQLAQQLAGRVPEQNIALPEGV